MKLSQLNSAIRKAEIVKIWFRATIGTKPLLIAVQKSSLLDALKVAFDGERSAETGMHIRAEDCVLVSETIPPDPALDDEWDRQTAAQMLGLDPESVAAIDALDDDDPFADTAPRELVDDLDGLLG